MVAICEPAKAAKARGPRKQVQRLGSGSSWHEQSTMKRKQKRASIEAKLVFGEMEVRGRARMNAGVVTSDELGGVARLQERRRSLMAKKKPRRSVMVNGVAPGGTMKLHEVPDRADYVYGDEGTAAYKADMVEFMAGNIDDDGVEARTLDWRELNGRSLRGLAGGTRAQEVPGVGGGGSRLAAAAVEAVGLT